LNDSFDSVECCFDIVAGVDGALLTYSMFEASSCRDRPIPNHVDVDADDAE